MKELENVDELFLDKEGKNTKKMEIPFTDNRILQKQEKK
jgi:hypothetical protein